ncbi:MAG: hypothetical protein ACHQHN_08015 [Sphingobacteriales bacterium]
MRKEDKYAFVCLAAGSILCWVNHGLYTPNTMIESLLIIFSLAVLVPGPPKIMHSGDPDDVPSGEIKIWRTVNAYIVQPVSICFLYACSFLLLMKYFFPAWSGALANLIYFLNRLNEDHFKFIILLFLSIMAIMAWLELVPYRRSIEIKKLLARFSYPFKVVAAIALFVHADSRISDQAIIWKMNKEAEKTESRVSFNYTAGQIDTIRQIKDLYIEIIVDRVIIVKTRLLTQTPRFQKLFSIVMLIISPPGIKGKQSSHSSAGI